MLVELDRIDRSIIAALSRNGRLSMTGLAGKVGLSKTPVQARARRLEADGYIRGYSAIVDREKMGEGHVAFVQVTLSDTRSAALDAFNRAVIGIPEVEQCHMIAASFDYLLKVRTRDIAAFSASASRRCRMSNTPPPLWRWKLSRTAECSMLSGSGDIAPTKSSPV
jgi:Lrp/AsnC family leucine-responsive transcriptional regulator